ncbi:hypothetical protein B0O99DRAFT_684552 [Bisporella sp. PMI_857]|nr:hypothetical protein B0O99DRAFT_684552 [Bisporella sp. PMI_857]
MEGNSQAELFDGEPSPYERPMRTFRVCIDGHEFDMSSDIPEPIVDILFQLYYDDDAKYKDIPQECLQYEVKRHIYNGVDRKEHSNNRTQEPEGTKRQIGSGEVGGDMKELLNQK